MLKFNGIDRSTELALAVIRQRLTVLPDQDVLDGVAYRYRYQGHEHPVARVVHRRFDGPTRPASVPYVGTPRRFADFDRVAEAVRLDLDARLSADELSGLDHRTEPLPFEGDPGHDCNVGGRGRSART